MFDKVLTHESGFLHLVEPGNTILANCDQMIWPFKEHNLKYQHSPVGRGEKLNTQNTFLP